MGNSKISQSIFAITLFLSLVITPFLVSAQTPSQEEIGQISDGLEDFITDELNIRDVDFTIDVEVISMVVNVGNDSAEMLMGKVSLLASAAGAAAPWTKELQLSVYSGKAPLAYIKIPTAKIQSYTNGEIGLVAYMKSWVFKGVEETSNVVNNGGEIDADPGVLATQNPTADSHVYAYSYRNWNISNWGKYENLGAGWHPTGGEKRTYLKFDLSSIDPDSFEKATLKLFHSHTGGGNAVALGVHRVTSPWVEGNDTYHSGQNEKPANRGEITWVNQPSFDPTPVLGFNPGKGINKWIELDITKLVKAWLSGVPNHGLIIKAQGPLNSKPVSQYGFYSREFKQADKHPVLVLSGTGSSVMDDKVGVDGNVGVGDINGEDLSNALVSGSYNVAVASGAGYLSVWKLNVSGRHISGKSEWICCPGRRIDPLKGSINGDTVVIQRDCTGQGYKGQCLQVYTGKLKGDVIEGNFTQNGRIAGSWTLSLSEKPMKTSREFEDFEIRPGSLQDGDDQSQVDKSDSLTKEEAYALYMAAYNKLTALMSKGDGDTPAGKRAYQELRKAKDVYEATSK